MQISTHPSQIICILYIKIKHHSSNNFHFDINGYSS